MAHALFWDIQHTNRKNLQNRDSGLHLKRLKESGKPINIILTPYQRDQWKHLEDEIGELVARPGSGLFLEGLIHACSRKNHTIRDPYHEHICTSFFQPSAPYLEQSESIQQGLDFLFKIFRETPIGYVPPQHLWDRNTLKAVAESNVHYLVTNALSPDMYPYREGTITVVPSGSIKHGNTESPVVHSYYDLIDETARSFEAHAVPLSEIPVCKKTFQHSRNQLAIRFVKQFRDFKRLRKYITSRKARQQPDSNTLRKERQSLYDEHQAELFQQ